jgi:acyl-CoA oxidase
MSTTPRIDQKVVADALYGKWKTERLEGRKLAADPRFQTIPGQSMDEHRERALEQLGLLVEAGAIQRAFPARFGGADNHGGNIAGFQELVFADPSMQIKSGVQW